MNKLNRNTTNIPVQRPERILQFGGGNFLRAFCDWMFHVLNLETDFNSSVVIVKPTKRGDYVELKAQDGLFHVALDGIRDGALHSEITLVESISRVIQPYNAWKDYLKTAEQAEMRFLVSNTTEAGIKFSESDQLKDEPAHEFPAKLTQWLFHRFNHFDGAADKGMILLPCELIEDNGEALKTTVLQYAELWKLGEGFVSWINNHNYFCSTLVDRIVSGYPKDRADELLKSIGFDDELLVAGEYYNSWVIKAPIEVQSELPFAKTDLNVQFVEDLGSYREMKVRVLNGAHTSLVPVGVLAGIETVIESMSQAEVIGHVQNVLSEEVKPTLIDFSATEIDAFIQAVLDRFKNPTLQHFLMDISLNSTSKFQARLLPAFLDYVKMKGTFPKRIAFSLACLIRFYKGEFNGSSIVRKDNSEVLQFFDKEWSSIEKNEQPLEVLVKNTLSNPLIVGKDISSIEGLVPFIAGQITNIESKGVVETLKTI